jgi:S-(hydroxymethyl)mycothiol dehydrogenase
VTRGVVYAGPDAAPAIEELTVDDPGPREVRVRVEACGLCHSDLHVVETKGRGDRFPILLGHEGAGVVEEIGADVTLVAPGDRVVIAWRAPCGDSCPACRRGDPRRCSNNFRAKRRMHRAVDGALLTPVLRCGTFADHAVVHEACAVKMPDELPLEQACLLACGFSTGAGSALWTTPVREGSSVAVIGCGGVGLAVVQGAKLAGAERIVAVDIAQEKLDVAKELGATDTVDASSADAVEAVRELTGGFGVEFAFSAVGSAAALDQAIRMCAYAGTATLVGLPFPGEKLDVDLVDDIFDPKVTIAVTHGGDTIPQEDFPVLAQAALDGKIDLARFVTSTISLEEVPDRLPRIGEGGEIRTVALL